MPVPSARSSAGVFTSLSHRSAPLALTSIIALAAISPSMKAQTVTPPQEAYTLTDLGTLPGGLSSYGFAINISGDVAGNSFANSGVEHAVLFKEGHAIDLGLVPGANSSVAYGINGYDEVTGALQFPESDTFGAYLFHTFLYNAGNLKDLGTAPGYDSSSGTAINDSGQIAGGSPLNGSEADNTVYLDNAGRIMNIIDFYTNRNLAANNINASGQIAGYTTGLHAAILIEGSIQLLDLQIPPSFPSQASAINDSGQATGWLYYPDNKEHAFFYSNGEGTDIGTLPPPYQYTSYGNSINASGQIVGDSLSVGAEPDTKPFLYTPGEGMISLQSLVPVSSRWLLTDATAINDKGQITGAALNPQGVQHAYLLSPVFVPFLTMDAVADFIGPSKTTFAAGGRFTLGAKSDGINLLKETAILQLGGYHIALPPSSFVEKNGVFTYRGKIGNVTLEAIVRRVGPKIYLFGIVGQGAAGLPKDYPLNLVLTIGNDTGREEIKQNYNAGQLSKAEICRDFGLICDN
jgi:probable HAF family extracellular repeat protein